MIARWLRDDGLRSFNENVQFNTIGQVLYFN